MKKVVSIPLMILILFSGITIKLASHYCMGSLVSSKMSFSGELATCGMEDNGNTRDGINAEDTCANISHSYTFSSNYIPSFEKNTIRINNVANGLTNLKVSLPEDLLSGININFLQPPGGFSPSSVARDIICVYRI